MVSVIDPKGTAYKLLRIRPEEMQYTAEHFGRYENMVPMYFSVWQGVFYITPKIPKGWRFYRYQMTTKFMEASE